MTKKILLAALFVALYLTVFDLFVEGPVGLSLETYACLGKELEPGQILMKKMPKKNFGFRYPFDFRYAVSGSEPDDAVYCLGKSVKRIK